MAVTCILLLVAPIVGFCTYVFVPCFVVHNLDGEERAGCFTLFIFLVSCECYCSVALSDGLQCVIVVFARV